MYRRPAFLSSPSFDEDYAACGLLLHPDTYLTLVHLGMHQDVVQSYPTQRSAQLNPQSNDILLIQVDVHLAELYQTEAAG